MAPSRRSIVFRRWSFFVTAIWLMIFSGTLSFSNYSTSLKEVLGLNQKELNRLSVAKDFGDSCGVLAGIVSNYVPASVVLFIGATVNLVGYGTQWLVVSQTIDPLPYWMMLIAAVLGGNCISWINTATFTTCVRNFPRNRGPVVGLLKAYMGLSAAVLARICDLAFSGSESRYLLLQAVLPAVFCCIAACFVRTNTPAETEEDEAEEKQSLAIFNVMAICLAITLTVLNILSFKTVLLKSVALGTLLLIGVAAPIFVLVYLGFRSNDSSNLCKQDVEENGQSEVKEKDSIKRLLGEDVDKQSSLRQALLNGSPVKQTAISSSETRSRRGCCSCEPLPELGEDRRTLTLFRSWDFYVLYLSLVCGSGMARFFNNNQGQIAQSLGFSSAMRFTTFLCLGNFAGRILSGNVSERFIRTRGLPRPVWIGVAKLPMIAMFAWLSRGSAASLYVSSVVLGLSAGTWIALGIPTVSELYGLKGYATNFMVTNTNLLVGSLVFSELIAGYLYDMEAQKQQDVRWWRSWPRWLVSSEGTLTCYGSSCYGTTLLILCGVQTASLVLDAILSFASRPLYKKLQRINTRFAQRAHDDLD